MTTANMTSTGMQTPRPILAPVQMSFFVLPLGELVLILTVVCAEDVQDLEDVEGVEDVTEVLIVDSGEESVRKGKE